MPAKFDVQITRRAEEDLVALWDYLAEESVQIATKWVSLLETQSKLLSTFPERCPSIPENHVLGTAYRHLLVGDYRLIFQIQDRTVYIARIIHGARLLDSSFF